MGCFTSKDADEDNTVYDMSLIRHLPVIFVNGVPGAGNQTVAQTISSITGYTMVRPGELIRAEATKDTPRGRMIADKLNAQEDIPEQLTVNLIKEEMLAQQDAKGFILVGFPKNPRMSNMFSRQVKWPEKVVALEVDNEYVIPDEDCESPRSSDADDKKYQYSIEIAPNTFPGIDIKSVLQTKSQERFTVLINESASEVESKDFESASELESKDLPTIDEMPTVDEVATVVDEVAATRLQNKMSELGRPEADINAARQIVRQAAYKVKTVHKRFGGHVVTLDSSGNPKALATTLKEILSDTIGKEKNVEEIAEPGPAATVEEVPPVVCPLGSPGVGDAAAHEIEIREQEM